ncbi:MAG: ORF6N domain-containing protein [Chitinophagaceae bacterium]|nr:MAG: ORF6N domain-containing protein [Chitinophagaceae bacterium]
MNSQSISIQKTVLRNLIYTIRGKQVMTDSDLAELYGVETKVLNQGVKRNKERFPEEFCFQLTHQEMENLRSQFVTSSSDHGGRRYLPYVFTEQGVAMLSAILRSEAAVRVSIQIMKAFVEMRKFLKENGEVFMRLDHMEGKQVKFEMETNQKFDRIFNAPQAYDGEPKQGIFFNGQVFDAHRFTSDLIRKAKESIILIDNYIDDTVLSLFTKRNNNVDVIIYTKTISKQLTPDLKKYNDQYKPIKIEGFTDAHDRFMIIDHQMVYHIGASLKDLGKKWFAFSMMDISAWDMINKLKNN